MCLAHGEDEITVNILTGAISCRRCSAIRTRRSKLRHDNRKTPGRHPHEMLNRIPNDLLRARYEELTGSGDMTPSEIARAAGYITKRSDGRAGGDQPDIQRLKKQLGITKQRGRLDPTTGERPVYATQNVGYDTAVALCRAMAIEYPAEVGV